MTIASSATFAETVTVQGRLNVDTPSPGLTVAQLNCVGTLGGSGEFTVTGSLSIAGSMAGTGITHIGPSATVSFGQMLLDRAIALSGDRPALVLNGLPTFGSNGRFDLANNALVIDNTSQRPQTEALVRIGRAGGSWTGNGITSSAIASHPGTGIGVALSSEIFSTFPATFAGTAVDSTAILLRHTVEGDLNLDRTVNFDDLLILAQRYGTSLAVTEAPRPTPRFSAVRGIIS